MKIILIAASALALMTSAALAGEGNSEPFPNWASTGRVVANQVARDTGSEGSPSYGPGVTVLTQGDTLPTNGGNGIVQTANSLPPAFEEGTVAHTQTRLAQNWMREHQYRTSPKFAQRTAP